MAVRTLLALRLAPTPQGSCEGGQVPIRGTKLPWWPGPHHGEQSECHEVGAAGEAGKKEGKRDQVPEGGQERDNLGIQTMAGMTATL